MKHLVLLSAPLLALLPSCGADAVDANEAAATPPEPVLPVELDERALAGIPLAALTPTPQPLVQLLDGSGGDPASWVQVEARGSEGRGFTVRQPATLHADADISVSRQPEGAVQVGLYPRATPERPKLLVLDATAIVLRTSEPPPPEPVRLEASTLTIQVGDAPAVELPEATIDELAQLGRERGGTGEMESRDGGAGGEARAASEAAGERSLRRELHLADVLASVTPVDGIAEVYLFAPESGESTTVSGDELALRGTGRPVLKRNTKGRWVLRIQRREGALQLRDIGRITVQKR